MRCKPRFGTAVCVLFSALVFQPAIFADTYTPTVFATGGTDYNLPDSVTFANGSGMSIGELFASVDSEDAFGTVNLGTGLFTAEFGGHVSAHGLAFQSATSEPSTVVLALSGTLLFLAASYVRRRRSNKGRKA